MVAALCVWTVLDVLDHGSVSADTQTVDVLPDGATDGSYPGVRESCANVGRATGA